MTWNCKLVFGKLVCNFFLNRQILLLLQFLKTCLALQVLYKDAQVMRIKCLLFSGLGSRVPPSGCHQHPLLDRNPPAWASAVAGQSSDSNGLPTQSHFLCILMHCRTRGIVSQQTFIATQDTKRSLSLTFQWMFMVPVQDQPGSIMRLNKQLCGQISVALFLMKKYKKLCYFTVCTSCDQFRQNLSNRKPKKYVSRQVLVLAMFYLCHITLCLL